MGRRPDEQHGEEGARGREKPFSDGADEGAIGEEDEDADGGDVFEVWGGKSDGGRRRKRF